MEVRLAIWIRLFKNKDFRLFNDMNCKKFRPVCVVVTDLAIGAIGLGLDSQVGQIGRSVAEFSPPYRRFI